MKYFLAVLFIFFAAAGGITRGQERLSLEMCIRTAFENNLDIRSGELQAASAAERYSGAGTARLPELSVAGSYTRLNAIDPFLITLPGAIRQSIFPNIQNNYSMTLRLQQPVFTGFGIESSITKAQHAVQVQEHALEETENTVRYAVEQYFWQLVAAAESETVIDGSISTLEQHVRDAVNFRESGMATSYHRIACRHRQARPAHTP